MNLNINNGGFFKETVRTVALAAAWSMLFLSATCANLSAETPDYFSEIAHLPLEDLLNQEVSSVLRKEETLSEAPAALYVLTAEDIRRSGAVNIPEALRLVPGLNVVRESANTWQVTSRGFDTDGTAKLLVLIDGRSVYSPLFSGVFWDVQDVMLEDIERIEIIRGPGAVSWGENAVNGVINIITRDAQDTQGALVGGGGGKEEKGFASMRYGSKVGSDTAYRVYGKYFDRGNFHFENGDNAEDGWDMLRGGFRADSRPSTQDHITVQGDIYNGKSSQRSSVFTSFAPPFYESLKSRTDLRGGNALARLTRDLSTSSQLAVQTYFDHTYRSTEIGTETRDTYDVDLQHRFHLLPSHEIVYGGDYRVTSDEIRNSLSLSFDPAARTNHSYSAFIQDEYTIIPDTFSVIPGIKLGHNDYSGFEHQPALKALWMPAKNHTVWGAVSRAVRTPARIDNDVQAAGAGFVLPDGTPGALEIVGNHNFESETLMAYEIGYRAAPSKSFTFDVTSFFQSYDHLLSFEPLPPFVESNPSPPHFVNAYQIENNSNGKTYGVESFATWRVLENFTLSATYTYTQVSFSADRNSQDPVLRDIAGRTPNNQATLRAHFNLPYNLEFDTILYYVDSIPSYNVPSYIRTDARLGWRASPNVSFDLIGQNLFDPAHREYGDSMIEIERAYFGKVTLRFDS